MSGARSRSDKQETIVSRQKSDKKSAASASASSSSTSTSKQQPKTVLFPGTVKQFFGATLDPRLPGRLQIEGLLLTDVTIVGHVKSVDDHDLSCFSFTLEDRTGEITVQKNEHDPNVKVGQLIRVFGSLRTTTKLTAFVIRPATEQEYEFHTLEAEFIRGHMNGSLPVNNKTKTIAIEKQSSDHDVKMEYEKKDEKKETNFPELEKQVIKSLESGRDSDIGMTLEEICNGITETGVSAASVRDMIVRLLERGILYHTLDDLHFKLA